VDLLGGGAHPVEVGDVRRGLDRQSITLCPELVGGRARLFDDAPAGSSWSLTAATPTPSGAICLLYDRRPVATRVMIDHWWWN
jgi:hypothetical protein